MSHLWSQVFPSCSVRKLFERDQWLLRPQEGMGMWDDNEIEQIRRLEKLKTHVPPRFITGRDKAKRIGK